MKRVHRSKEDRMIAGVFGGISEHYQIDSAILRLVGIFMLLATGILPLLITYIVAILMIPEEGEDVSETERKPIWKRWWFWLVIIILTIVIVSPVVVLLGMRDYFKDAITSDFIEVNREMRIRPESTGELVLTEPVMSTYRDTIIDYLTDGIVEPTRGGEIFADYYEMGRGPNELYIWAHISEFYREDGELKAGSGVSHPMTLTLSNSDGSPTEHLIPRDGSYYAESLREIFPTQLHNEALNFQTVHRRTLDSLIESVETKAQSDL